MNNLNDFKDDINKCSKCGLCQSVCPVYKITGNDCAVSRGKFVMLDGVIKGDLKLNKNIEKYLDASNAGSALTFVQVQLMYARYLKMLNMNTQKILI